MVLDSLIHNIMTTVLASTLLLLCAFIQYTHSAEYMATVVEYRSTSDEANTVLRNVQNYVDEIEKISSDIIVFPEYGLTTIDVFTQTNWKKDYTLYVPANYNNIILCDETSHVEKALKDISCAAKRKNMYVVINFLEKDNSTKNDLFYSTNLVFDRSGKIAAKYRKINLYEEDNLTPGKDIVTFETDFSVKFGIFTSYDILFKDPASDILTNDINDIIYPTAWISATPFSISLSVQAGYAKKNKVNLLAANYNNPSKSNGGSGIYKSSGVSGTTYISGQHKTEIITLGQIESIARTKSCKIIPDPRTDGTGGEGRAIGTVPTLNDFVTEATSFEGYANKFKVLSGEGTSFKDEICDGDVCCKFEADTSDKVSTDVGVYKWVLYQKDGSISCALLYCKTLEDSTCGGRIDENTMVTFTRISVAGNFPKAQYTMPITSRVSFKPIYEYTYCPTNKDADNEEITMEIYEGFHKNVTTFGIVGRLKAGAGALWGNAVVVAILGLYAIFRNYI